MKEQKPMPQWKIERKKELRHLYIRVCFYIVCIIMVAIPFIKADRQAKAEYNKRMETETETETETRMEVETETESYVYIICNVVQNENGILDIEMPNGEIHKYIIEDAPEGAIELVCFRVSTENQDDYSKYEVVAVR